MRSQCAVYVDAGYLLAATATRVTGTSLRSGVEVDFTGLIDTVIDQAQRDSGLPLLRVNWYDSGSRPGGLPDYTQERIGLTPRVKLRLGRRSLAGEQKGVDLRIGLDLATHGRARVADVMYLVSGDDDLTEAVEEAQSHGVQVTLLAVPNHAGRPQSVARHLQRAADGLLLIDATAIDLAVRARAIPDELVPRAGDRPGAEDGPITLPGLSDTASTDAGSPGEQPPRGASATRRAAEAHPSGDGVDGLPSPALSPKPSALAGRRPTQVLPPPPAPAVPGPSPEPWEDGEVTVEAVYHVARQVVEGWCAVATPDMVRALRAAKPTIPHDLDRALLVDLSSRAGVYDISDGARNALRERFWFLIDRVRLG